MRPFAIIGGLAILVFALVGWIFKSEPSRWPEQGTFEQQA